MGRHKAMTALTDPTQHTSDTNRENRGVVSGEVAPSRYRRLSVVDLTADQREHYATLRTAGIRVPDSPLRDAAVERAAMVWSCVKPHTELVDLRAARVLARYLHSEGSVHQLVDEERALTRAAVDRHMDSLLGPTSELKLSSLRTHRWVFYTAGAVVYPREFPAPRTAVAPRTPGSPAARYETAAELYALAPALPTAQSERLVLALDLVTGAGARPSEMRNLTGGDVTPLQGSIGGALVSFRDRGTRRRVVPVLHISQAERLLRRARKVGASAPLLPLNRKGEVSRDVLCGISADLVRRGYSGVDFGALRTRWVMELAAAPGIPTSALLALTGMTDLRVLLDRVDQLPHYSPAELTGMVAQARDLAGGVL